MSGGPRSGLYSIARLLGDMNSVSKGKTGKRIGRRAAGRMSGKLMSGLFKKRK